MFARGRNSGLLDERKKDQYIYQPTKELVEYIGRALIGPTSSVASSYSYVVFALGLFSVQSEMKKKILHLITGEKHWELLQRSRALDNMLYVASCATAYDEKSEYQSWGHSMVVDPWGKVIGSLGDYSENLIVEINLKRNIFI